MNKITPHIPNFVDIERPDPISFNTTIELLELDFVQDFKEKWGEHTFYRFSLDNKALVAEYDNGEWWWCVGHLKSTEGIDLPVVSYKKKKDI